MKFNTSRSKLSLIIGALCASSALTVHAAEETTQTEKDALAIERITVNSSKRVQRITDVPMSVTAIGSEELINAGISNADDLARKIPVMEVLPSTSPSDVSIRIRRVGNLGNIPSFEPAVATFIDGAFRSRSLFGAGDLFDIARVEVLSGPQSTLYGKNATGGVVSYYTTSPSDVFEWKAEATAGSIDGGAGSAGLYRFKGGVSGALSDSVNASLGGSFNYTDDTLGNSVIDGGVDTNDQESFTIRGQLAWDVSANMDARLIVGVVNHDSNTTTNDISYEPNDTSYIGSFILPTLQAAGLAKECTENSTTNRKGCQIDHTKSDIDAEEVTLLIDYDFDNGMTLNSITSWDHMMSKGQQNDVGQIMMPVLKFHDTHENESWQQELRLSSSMDNIDWMVGAFYYRNEFDRGDNGDRPTFLADELAADPTLGAILGLLVGAPEFLMATEGQLGYLDSSQDTDYYAFYGQATWAINDEFSITGGARWQKEEKEASVRQWTNDPTPTILSFLLSPDEPNYGIEGGKRKRDTDEVTWSVSPQWFVNEDTMLFATASNGFKSGGFNLGFGQTQMDDREFKDEDIMHYEAGVKTNFWNGRVTLNATAFMTDYDDYQDGVFVSGQFKVGNADKVELRGFEFDGEAQLTENLRAEYAASYADLEYKDHTNGACHPLATPLPNGSCDLSGENPINAPEWKTNVGMIFEDDLSFGDYYVRGDWSWTSKFNQSFSADPNLVQDAYSWLNFRAGVRWDNYELVAWADNALNEDVITLAAEHNLLGGAGEATYQTFMQPGRTIGLTFRMNY